MKCIDRRFRPTFYEKSVFAIPLPLLYQLGYRYVFVDLDNTLAAYYETQPSELTKSFLQACDHAGLLVTITSNNTETRVQPFAQACGVPF